MFWAVSVPPERVRLRTEIGFVPRRFRLPADDIDESLFIANPYILRVAPWAIDIAAVL